MSDCDCNSMLVPLIAVSVYCSVLHVVLVVAFTWKRLCRNGFSKKQVHEELSPSDIESLTESKEETEYSDSQNLRLRSSPRPDRIISEYDTFTCSSKPKPGVQKPIKSIIDPPNSPPIHQYEELGSSAKAQKHRQYETILEQVASTLSVIYCDRNEAPQEVYAKFFTELVNRIRAKNPELYESIHNYAAINNNHYAEIKDDTSTGYASAEESTYATYIPSSIDKKKLSGECTTHVNSFGSTDHLKYFVESRKVEKNVNNEPPYLSPNRYSATENCPEELRSLCKSQASLSETYKIQPDRIMFHKKHNSASSPPAGQPNRRSPAHKVQDDRNFDVVSGEFEETL